MNKKESLYELILMCQKNDNDSFEIICKKFEPLIFKYGKLLNYTDAYYDIKYCFILCIYKMPIFQKNFENNDAVILSYIKTAIKNEYISLNKKYEEKLSKQYSYDELATEITDYSYKREFQNLLTIIDLKNILDENDFKLIYLKFYLNYKDKEIAKYFGVSRQAVNKRLHKIMDKLYSIYKKEVI